MVSFPEVVEATSAGYCAQSCTWQAMLNAGCEYAPRHPETTVLYQVVAEQLETFLNRQQDRDHPVPGFVEDEFRFVPGLWSFGPCLFASSGPIVRTRSVIGFFL